MLTYDIVRELFDYDLKNGILTKDGIRAGYKDSYGYLTLNYEDNSYKVHRVIWLWMTGKWPEGIIDHVDRKPSNNKWENLRDTNKTNNAINSKLRVDNSCGFTGVSYKKDRNKYKSYITKGDKRQIHLGYFDDIEDAISARIKAEVELYGEYSPNL